jgi:hypothetical protein
VADLAGLVGGFPGEARLHVTGRAGRVAPEAGHAVYRAVQEALTNAARYATGSAIEVNAAWGERELRVAVRDHGLPAGRAPSGVQGSGTGLRSMAERIESVGGSLSAGRVPGEPGWRIVLRVPVLPQGSGVPGPADGSGAGPERAEGSGAGLGRTNGSVAGPVARSGAGPGPGHVSGAGPVRTEGSGAARERTDSGAAPGPADGPGAGAARTNESRPEAAAGPGAGAASAVEPGCGAAHAGTSGPSSPGGEGGRGKMGA